MPNISPLTKNITKYTTNGNRLISQTRELFGEHSINWDKDMLTVPFRRVIQIETNFGKTIKTITSYENLKGKPIKKIISEYKDKEEISRVTREYNYHNGITEIKTSKTYRGGINYDNTTDIISQGSCFNNPEQPLSYTHIKFHTQNGGGGERLEHQIYEALIPGKGRIKHLETFAKRLSDGQITNPEIRGSNLDIAKLSEDPYLFIRNYNMPDFTQSAHIIAEKEQNIQDTNGKFLMKKLAKLCGYYDNSTKTVVVDPYNELTNKTQIVDTLNHEYRHQFQSTKGCQFFKRFLNLFNKSSKKSNMETDLSYAIRCKFSEITYYLTYLSEKLYHKNFSEIDATKAGITSAKKYEKYCENLANNFGGPDEIFRFHDNKISSIIKDFILGKIKINP